jgi:hypothetical protein
MGGPFSLSRGVELLLMMIHHHMHSDKTIAPPKERPRVAQRAMELLRSDGRCIMVHRRWLEMKLSAMLIGLSLIVVLATGENRDHE